mmetsp:Transcript_53600/g.122679  ORF Transcript_53600/g.122679 Transcript_53600/m.122679 type:complete len:250 (-) Transcript_53600:991-1740(-)
MCSVNSSSCGAVMLASPMACVRNVLRKRSWSPVSSSVSFVSPKGSEASTSCLNAVVCCIINRWVSSVQAPSATAFHDTSIRITSEVFMACTYCAASPAKAEHVTWLPFTFFGRSRAICTIRALHSSKVLRNWGRSCWYGTAVRFCSMCSSVTGTTKVAQARSGKHSLMAFLVSLALPSLLAVASALSRYMSGVIGFPPASTSSRAKSRSTQYKTGPSGLVVCGFATNLEISPARETSCTAFSSNTPFEL